MSRQLPVHKLVINRYNMHGIFVLVGHTLCGRMAWLGNDNNITDNNDKVTCRLCKAKIQAEQHHENCVRRRRNKNKSKSNKLRR